jgi:hypothetical protein
LLCDSDAFILFGACGLVREAGEVLGVGLEDIRRLHPLPLMLDRGKLERKYPPAIREKVKSWCAVIEPITEAPSEATRQRLVGIEGIHDGENDLFGLLFENPDYLLLSGDKVAMRSLCNGPGLEDIFRCLCGRVACTEVVLLGLLRTLGVKVLANSLAPMRPYSGTLNAVLSMGADSSQEHCHAGFSSYLRDLTREVGPSFLLSLPND